LVLSQLGLDTTSPLKATKQTTYVRQHAGSSTTTSPSTAAHAWRCWWYVDLLSAMTRVAVNTFQALLRLLRLLLLEVYHPGQLTRK
jgi:hypothetical protein